MHMLPAGIHATASVYQTATGSSSNVSRQNIGGKAYIHGIATFMPLMCVIWLCLHVHASTRSLPLPVGGWLLRLLAAHGVPWQRRWRMWFPDCVVQL
jgi:hypothetical protein